MIALLSLVMLALSLASGVHGQVGSAIYTTDSLPELTVVTEPPNLVATQGGNLTLPCRLHRTSSFHFGNSGMRVKWTKYSPDLSQEADVFVSMGFHKKAYGKFQGRAFLQEADDSDATLIITNVALDDYGKYKCEVIDGMDDNVVEVTVEFNDKGVVFPYFPRLGRYNLNYPQADKACQDQGAVLASFEQLYDAWQDGLDWCNAGWLNDGTVQYPITKPREPCGGTRTAPGLRTYGFRNRFMHTFDAFCFTGNLRGRFYWLVQPDKLTFAEAVQACRDDGAEIAKVAHMYAAWKLQKYDRCDAGWLADGSVRYPISNPRNNCSPTEAAVRMVGYPDKKQKLYGVYCYKTQ